MRIPAILVVLVALLAGCAQREPYSRSSAYQPNAQGIYTTSGQAAGFFDYYGSGFGYANPLSDPGPATAAVGR